MLNLYITDILQKPTSTEPNKQRKSGTWRLCKVDSPVPPEGKEENILHNVLTSTDVCPSSLTCSCTAQALQLYDRWKVRTTSI